MAPAPTHTTSPAVHSASRSAGSWCGQPGRQHVAVQRRGDERRALELGHHLDQRVRAPAGPTDPVPAGQEPGQGGGVDRLDLAAQRGQRPATQLAQHLVVAPLPLHALGPELAPHHAALALELLEGGPHRRRGDAVAPAGCWVRNGPWVRA